LRVLSRKGKGSQMGGRPKVKAEGGIHATAKKIAEQSVGSIGGGTRDKQPILGKSYLGKKPKPSGAQSIAPQIKQLSKHPAGADNHVGNILNESSTIVVRQRV